MTQTIELPDGTHLKFPDGMSQAAMAAAIYASFPQYATKNRDQLATGKTRAQATVGEPAEAKQPLAVQHTFVAYEKPDPKAFAQAIAQALKGLAAPQVKVNVAAPNVTVNPQFEVQMPKQDTPVVNVNFSKAWTHEFSYDDMGRVTKAVSKRSD